MSEEIEEQPDSIPEPDPIPPTDCPFCVDGLKMVGWDEEGNDILEPCGECNGTGIYEY